MHKIVKPLNPAAGPQIMMLRKRICLLVPTLLAAAVLLSACAGGAALPLPTSTRGPEIRPSATLDERLPTPSGQFLNHEVTEWDTCESIASDYGIEVQALMDANGLAADCSNLYLGQVLFIPLPAGGTHERLSVPEAEELVRAQIFATQPGMNPAARFPLGEMTSDEVWEQLGVQVFKVQGEVLLNQGYVIHDEQVTPVGESFGGSGVHTLLLAELDGKPPAELVYAYDFGSGVRLSGLGVYRVDEQGGRGYEISEFRYPGTLALELREGVVVIRGRLDQDGVERELGRLLWADGRPVVVPAE